MLTDESTQGTSQDMALAAPPRIAPLPEVQVVEGDHRALTPADANPLPQVIQTASNVAYGVAGGLIAVLTVAAFVVLVVWLIGDLARVGNATIPAGMDHDVFTRNLIITAVANFISNLALVFILLEVFNAIIAFLRTRRITTRPLLLAPLFIVMRAVITIGAQLLTTPPPAQGTPATQTFLELLLELAVFALVGLAISVGLAALREHSPKNN